MNAEFVDTNILIYAHDRSAGGKHTAAVQLLSHLFEQGAGALSVQVLSEFYAVAVGKLGMNSQYAEDAVADLGSWMIHRPSHEDVLRASRLFRRYKIGWWDAMLLNSALELGCTTLWSEDFQDGRRYGSLTLRNPFA
ncbi:MAG: PIN domain-containing protein [Bryobacteraceae bacterium]|jgi:predicted nucleic acid-binding protein